MANSDPIPAVNGDNVDERCQVLSRHLAESFGIVGVGKDAIPACPHPDARQSFAHLHYMPPMKSHVVLCQDCKALVLAYEAKHRAREQDRQRAMISKAAPASQERMTTTEALQAAMRTERPSTFAVLVRCPRTPNADLVVQGVASVCIEDGCLVLLAPKDRLLRAFAAGQWMTCERTTPAPLPAAPTPQ